MKKGPKMEKLNSRWAPGIFVGVKKMSNELMIATKDLVLKRNRS